MDLNQVAPEIYVGSCPRVPSDVEHLRRDYGITAVLSVQTDEDLEYLGIDLSHLQTAYKASNIEFRRVPVPDFDPDALRRGLPECVSVLARLLRSGYRVFVHCSAGVNRSPSTVIAYLAWVEHVEMDEAIRLVTDCRACQPYVDAIHAASRDRLSQGHQP